MGVLPLACSLVLSACTGSSPILPSTVTTTSGIPDHSPSTGSSGTGSSASGSSASGGSTAPETPPRPVGDFELLPAATATYLTNGSNAVGSGITPLSDGQVRTPEYLQNPGFDVVNLNRALNWGVTGKGVTIAVIDSGIDANHPDLVANIDAANSLSLIGGGYNDSAGSSHGTMVAGIAAGAANGSGMQGVAPDAELLAIKVTSNGNMTLANQEAGMNAARIRGADIINISFGLAGYENLSLQQAVAAGAVTASLMNTYREGVKADLIYTLAAGNSGSAQPEWDGKIAGYGVAKGQILVAGSLNAAGNDIASFSNRAGAAKNFYLLAPGENIVTTRNDGNLTKTSGTSFSAPFVAGAAALVKSAGPPGLSAKDVVAILLTSADDMGVAGTDSIYGAGRLNIGAALSPVGPRSVALSDNPNAAGVSLADTAVSNGGLLADSLARSALLNRVLFFDGFERPYVKDITAAQQDAAERDPFAGTGREDVNSTALSPSTELAVSYRRTFKRGLDRPEAIPEALRIRLKTGLSAASTARLSVGNNWARGLLQTTRGDGGLPESFKPKNFKTAKFQPVNFQPVGFMSLDGGDTGAGIALSHRISAGTGVNFLVGSGLNSGSASGDGSNGLSFNTNAARQLGFAEIGHAVTPSGKLHIGTGMLRERNQILGTSLGPAFSASGPLNTPFMTLGYRHRFSDRLNFGLSYSLGRVQGYSTQAGTSLVSGFSGGRLDAAGLWLGYQDQRRSLRLDLSRELGFRSGQLVLNVPHSLTYAGETPRVGFSRETIALKSPTVYGLGLNYQRSLGPNGRAGELQFLGRVTAPLAPSLTSGGASGTSLKANALIRYSRKF